jgi:deazaflavin-dependent oxidoreductase (nitroreductase family)
VTLDPSFAAEDFCYLTTTGRVSGNPHEIEIWFALVGSTAYMMNGDSDHPGGSADWVKNLRKQPAVKLRIAGRTFDAIARIVTGPEEDALVRRLILEKYQVGSLDNPDSWGRIALPIAIELQT